MIKIILAIIYAICPIDIIPDALPIVGWLDDIFFVYKAVKSWTK